MLDIPPPPMRTTGTTRQDSIVPSSPLSPGSPVSDEDVVIIPSSDEDQPRESGWKLVERSRKIDRRRTTAGRQRAGSGPTSPTEERSGRELPPVAEVPPMAHDEVINGGGTVTVTRSRTLPSSKRTPQREARGMPDERHQANVLRKQKRTTMQPPRSKPILSPANT